MPSQIAIASKNFAAGSAMIRLDVRVSEQVSFEITALIETSSAYRTLVRRFLHVKDFVNGQCSTLAEAFATLTAFERFLLAVDVPVISKI